jgi:hypothetical protein
MFLVGPKVFSFVKVRGSKSYFEGFKGGDNKKRSKNNKSPKLCLGDLKIYLVINNN